MATLVLTCDKINAKSGDILTFNWNSVDSSVYKEFQFYELSPEFKMETLALSQKSTTVIFPEGISAGANATYMVQARPLLDSGTYLTSNNVSVTALADTGGETPTTYIVTFNPNGGSVSPASGITDANGQLSSLPTPVYAGHRFDGWFTAASGGTSVTTDTVFSANTTIYAHWTEESSPPPPPAAGRLEQFQNSEGTNIYPKTVVEGVFRQSDGKSLKSILKESGGVTMEQVNEAIQQAVLDSWEGSY